MRRLFRHVSGVSIANATNGILGLIFVPVAVRRLGTAGYGEFAIYSVLASYIVLLELGLGKNLVRRLAKTSDLHERVHELRIATGLYFTIGAILIVLLPAVAFLVPKYLFPVSPELQGNVARIAMLAVLEYVIGLPVSIMKTRCVADESFGAYSRFSMASGFTRYGLGFLGVFLTTRADVLVAIIVGRQIVDFWSARWIMGTLPAGAWSPRFNVRDFRQLLQSSAALSIAQILQVVIVSVGAILVNRSFGVQNLGLYRAAFDLASRVWFFSSTLGLVLFPKFVRLLSNRENLPFLTRVVPSVITVSCVVFGFLALVAAVVSAPVLTYMGLKDPRYIQLFLPIVAALCLNAHANFAYEFTQAAGRYWNAAVIGLFSLSLFLVTFFYTRDLGPEMSIGLAWIASQVGYTFATDASVLSILKPSSRNTSVAMTIRAVAILVMIVGVFAKLGDHNVLFVAMLGVTSVMGWIAITRFRKVWPFPLSWRSSPIQSNDSPVVL